MFKFIWMLFLTSIFSDAVFARPPFVTSDADPAEYNVFEWYLASVFQRQSSGTIVNIPSIEFEYGILPNGGIDITIPYQVQVSRHHAPNVSGLGDLLISFEDRFVQETKMMPKIAYGFYVSLPTGNAKKDLGNGCAAEGITISLEKTWNTWTAYSSIQYTINPAKTARNFLYVGAVIEKIINDRWIFGGEVFTQGPAVRGESGYSVINFGGYFNMNKTTQMLFSLGHSFQGKSTFIGYAGFYWGV